MRQDAVSARRLTDPAAYEQHTILAREVSDVLRKNIVQASRTQEEDTWTLRITEDTELGSNESVKQTKPSEKASEPPAPALDNKSPRLSYSALKVAHKNRVLPELKEEDIEESFVRGSGPSFISDKSSASASFAARKGASEAKDTRRNV
ncbi:Peptide chain release factor C12orf65 like mitochondrial [Mycena chlorophos]|uniref:Peptide chain release factor C12orf65 like mitochondrial n=1 Tax=Mycena chlorophos TaxID=658473 RepID=A0A8H6TT50_MYCCL|nr:Peptide chain release factor C12orf65 like mitochondrial [Mycena chlorophos]